MTENELLLKMANAFQESKAWPVVFENKSAIYLAKVALDALPGMADVAAGKAVIMSVEALRDAERKACGRGMAIAAGIVCGSFGQDTIAEEILGAAGFFSVADMKKAGVDPYDIKLCRNALRR
jgi:hypothetical protein